MKKMVRDLVPAMIRDRERRAVPVEFASPQTRRTYLLMKLREEAGEAFAAGGGDELLGELADVYEVLRALSADFTGGLERVAQVADQKARDRGGLLLGMVMEFPDREGGPTIVLSVACDHAGCERTAQLAATDLVADAGVDFDPAPVAGWAFVSGLWYCPDHNTFTVLP